MKLDKVLLNLTLLFLQNLSVQNSLTLTRILDQKVESTNPHSHPTSRLQDGKNLRNLIPKEKNHLECVMIKRGMVRRLYFVCNIVLYCIVNFDVLTWSLDCVKIINTVLYCIREHRDIWCLNYTCHSLHFHLITTSPLQFHYYLASLQ